MSSITLKSSGDFKNLTRFLERAKEGFHIGILDKYGKQGVAALKEATPKDTGLTANSWYYKIENKDGVATLKFLNSNVNEGVPIAIILQYGHGTRTGGWVEGQDYINPALKPIFDQICKEAWKEITK